MNVRRHQFGIVAAALTLAFFAGRTADAGFVAYDSPDAFTTATFTTATFGSSARAEGKSDFEPPEWMKQILLITARNADASMDGTSTGTSSTLASMSHVAALGTALVPPAADPGQQLAPGGCPAHVSPDLGGLSPPPRG